MSDKYGLLRRHQRDAQDLATDVALGGRSEKVAVAYVTPGGGKTMLASIYAHELYEAGVIKRILFVCPRTTLQSQTRDGFHDNERGRRLALSVDLSMSLKQSSLHEKVIGYATTYQSIVANPERMISRMAKHKYLLVLDEAHHLAGRDPEDEEAREPDFRAWKDAIAPLVTVAKQVLVMTGTMNRSDGQPIPFVTYDEEKLPVADIRYTRRDALNEKAVLPIQFTMWDGEASYEYKGRDYASALRESSKKERARTLTTALVDTSPGGYVDRFLADALGQWAKYTRDHYASKVILVCHTQKNAKAIARHVIPRVMASIGRTANVVLAISDEAGSSKRIADFRTGAGDILVTVGMAYEGLDVPAATHLVCLSNRTAIPWLEQTVARVTRVNHDPRCYVPPERQHAYVFMPADPRLIAFADTILDEQDKPANGKAKASGGDRAVRRSTSFVPDGCAMGDALYGDDKTGILTVDESSNIQWMRKQFPSLANAPNAEILSGYNSIMKRTGNER